MTQKEINKQLDSALNKLISIADFIMAIKIQEAPLTNNTLAKLNSGLQVVNDNLESDFVKDCVKDVESTFVN